jgi:hypothetical protein
VNEEGFPENMLGDADGYIEKYIGMYGCLKM